MPVYECSVASCPNQYIDGTPRNYMYCVSHRALEPMADIVPDSDSIPGDIGVEPLQTDYRGHTFRQDAGADLEIKPEASLPKNWKLALAILEDVPGGPFKLNVVCDVAIQITNAFLEIDQDARAAEIQRQKKTIITLTEEQTADLREIFRKHHNNPTVGLRPKPSPTSLADYSKKNNRITKLEKALEEIKSTAAIQTGPVGRILATISRLAREALEDD